MSRSTILALVPLTLLLAANVLCQNKTVQPNPQIASSPAYAEVLVHKTELEAELESLLTEYTEDYPKVRDLRVELEVLKPEIDRIMAVKPADAGKLTQALGKLILGKAAHAATLKKLQSQFQDVHPSVKKEKRMVEIFEAAIREILG
jgi:uncharacterized protein involved in exopolysaccharide biosynthesis